jgi:HEAT repeat protein
MQVKNSKFKTESFFACKKEYKEIIPEVVENLLALSIADMDSQVRKTAISCLQIEFDEYLSSSAFLKTLFQALNDENHEVN